MITRIEIKNFQSHKHTVLDLSPGVNVFIGPTDSGKTSILRALRWLCTNKPNGDAFRSEWGGMTSVSITLENHVITREKDEKVNRYVLDGQELKAMGQGVPEAVLEVLNLSDINWQHQFGNIFLLNDSPGEVARSLNHIVSLEVIDKSLSNVERAKRKNSTDLDCAKERRDDLKELISQFDYLDDFEKELKALEKLGEKISEKEEQFNNLNSIIEGLMIQSNRIEKAVEVLKFKNDFEELSQKSKEKQEAHEFRNELKSIVLDIELYEKAIKKAELQYKVTKARYDKLMPDVCPLCGRSD